MIFCSVSMAQELTLYFAQVVDGGGYTTTFTVMNRNIQSVMGTVRLTDSNGNPWPMALTDGRTVSQFVISVPPLGTARFASTGQGPIKTGWASLTTEEFSFPGTGGAPDLSGVETIDYRSGSNLLDSVSVAGIRAGTHFAVPADISSVADTGFAVVNVGTGIANVRLALKSEDGVTNSAISDARLNPLAAGQYLCAFASEIFSTLKSNPFKGSLHVEAVGQGDIAVLGLSFKEGQLSSVPILWLQPSVSTTQDKAEDLAGHWVFTYTMGDYDPFTDEYTLSAEEDPLEPGMWYAAGTDEYNQRAIAGWVEELGYVLLGEGISFTPLYIFDFTGPDSVSGSFHLLFEDEGMSSPYPMTGVRTNNSTLGSAHTQTEPQIGKQMREAFEVRALHGNNAAPDPRIMRAVEHLRSLDPAFRVD